MLKYTTMKNRIPTTPQHPREEVRHFDEVLLRGIDPGCKAHQSNRLSHADVKNTCITRTFNISCSLTFLGAMTLKWLSAQTDVRNVRCMQD